MKTTSHSDDMTDLIYKFLKKWDITISTFDDEDTQILLKNKINRSMKMIADIQKKSDEKIIMNAKNESEKGKLLIENQNKKWYKNLTTVYNDLQYILYTINSLYELKNRKAHDNVTLRHELSKLKQELK